MVLSVLLYISWEGGKVSKVSDTSFSKIRMVFFLFLGFGGCLRCLNPGCSGRWHAARNCFPTMLQ